MDIKLAEALLRRKELQGQVARLHQIDQQNLFEVKARRQKVTDDVDDIVASVPKISIQQVTHAYNWHARALREIDAAIQQANWTTTVAVNEDYMKEYVDPYVK